MQILGYILVSGAMSTTRQVGLDDSSISELRWLKIHKWCRKKDSHHLAVAKPEIGLLVGHSGVDLCPLWRLEHDDKDRVERW